MQNSVLEKPKMPKVLKEIRTTGSTYFNLSPAELIEQSLERKEGKLTSTGALMADTGKFTGRSPKDRFIVLDEKTEKSVWWGDVNIPFDSKKFDLLAEKMKYFLFLPTL